MVLVIFIRGASGLGEADNEGGGLAPDGADGADDVPSCEEVLVTVFSSIEEVEGVSDCGAGWTSCCCCSFASLLFLICTI